MLVLFETPAGYSLFKVSDEKKLLETDADSIAENFFDSAATVRKELQMVNFQPFGDTAAAVAAATATAVGKVSPALSKFIKKKVLKEMKGTATSQIAVADKALAISLKEELLSSSLQVVHDSKTQELYRGIRSYLQELLDDGSAAGGGGAAVSAQDLRAMQLGLSHSLSRYKLKFSADKVDTMVIQAVGLLDELDKEINTYAMRCKEWYGWHFPELQGLLSSAGTAAAGTADGGGSTSALSGNVAYAKLVLKCGLRNQYRVTDLSDILQDERQAAAVKAAAEVSMGTEIAESDIVHIQHLAQQVADMTQYRTQLYEYLKNRMAAIAPNLTVLVGELVGARLISHAGSLMNLAKQPASTVQILGAEKALFRALKTKHDTPKYGLIYHASLVGQAAPKNKGKISRVLAAKAALAIRVDALTEHDDGDDDEDGDGTGTGTRDGIDTTVGYEGRAKVEARLRQLEGGSAAQTVSAASPAITAKKIAKYDAVAAKTAAPAAAYSTASDVVLKDVQQRDDGDDEDGQRIRKAQTDNDDDDNDAKDKKKRATKDKKKKKKKKAKSQEMETASHDDDASADGDGDDTKKKNDKKRKAEENDDDKAARKAAKKAKKLAKKEKKAKLKSKS